MLYLKYNNYIIKEPLINIVRHLQSILVNGKLAKVQDKGDNISICCPEHNNGQEQNPSCQIYCGDKNTEYGQTHCFTCGYNKSFDHFVADCLECSVSDARNWLIKNYGELTSSPTELLNIDQAITFTKQSYKNKLNESVLATFENYCPYLQARKLSRQTCEKFKVKYDPTNKQILFPVYDENNNLVMITRRSTLTKQFHIPSDVEKPIYLLNYIKENNIKTVVLVESQINALTSYEYGIPAIATFGCNITDKQFTILNKSGIRHYILCFDGDAAGRKGAETFKKNIRKDVFVTDIIMPPKKDLNDLSKDEFYDLLSQNQIQINRI